MNTYTYDTEVHGFRILGLLSYPSTRKWFDIAKRLGLADDALQEATLAVLERHEDATRSVSPRLYMSGVVGHAIRRLVTQHSREFDLPNDVFDATPGRATSETIVDDPFDLIEQRDREIVRDYMLEGSVRSPKLATHRLNVSTQGRTTMSKSGVHKRVKNAIDKARRTYANAS